MSKLSMIRYGDDRRESWNHLVADSRNGTFLFRREYMDYHRDRFEDHSLLLLEEDRPIALFPATVIDGALSSHAGLTYGGFVTTARVTTTRMLEAFSLLAAHARESGFRRILYKTIPHIYHVSPADDDRYALFRAGARLYRRDLTTVIDARDPLAYQQRRRRGVRKAERAGIEVEETRDLRGYWRVLETNLEQRHDLVPVHTVEEMELLVDRFPERIRLFGAFREGRLLAGVLLFLTRTVCHAQYTASAEEGRETGALDLLFDRLIQRFGDRRFFDFGVSTEDGGRHLNRGLTEYKESFGGRTVVHDFYELTID